MPQIPFQTGDLVNADGIIGVVKLMEVQMMLVLDTQQGQQLLALPIYELKNIQKL